MNITEIISHTSARIMLDIGERLKESICFRGRWNREKSTQEDTHTPPPPMHTDKRQNEDKGDTPNVNRPQQGETKGEKDIKNKTGTHTNVGPTNTEITKIKRKIDPRRNGPAAKKTLQRRRLSKKVQTNKPSLKIKSRPTNETNIEEFHRVY